MCQFSAYAEQTRDARQGEDLVVSMAPHGSSHWLTGPGKPDIAVCIPNQAPLAIQIAGSDEVRGGNFEHIGRADSLVFMDGKQERVALNDIPCGSKVRILALSVSAPLAPAPIATETATDGARDGGLVAVGARST
jgi:hypothetical protein